MTATPQIQAPEALGLTVQGNIATVEQTVSQGMALTVYNLPTKHIQAPQASAAVVRHGSGPMEATQAGVLAVVQGRVAEPAVRASTFTLHGHDFYMLRLGDAATLIYDVATGEWTDWASENFMFWRANCAFNWVGGQKPGFKYGGSNIVIGDDTWGLLYFLDPTQAWDDHPDSSNPNQQLPFTRIATAQTTVSGRNNVPCYAIFLNTDNYELTAQNFTPFVTLDTSDDQGQTWQNQGYIYAPIVPTPANYVWASLGQMTTPGRLFKVTDNGLLARLDSMEMNDV